MRPMVTMTGQMKLRDTLRRNRAEVFVGIEAMVECTDEDIVDVEKDAAVRFFRDDSQKVPFGHRRIAKAHVAGDVLNQDPAFQEILHLAEAARDMAYRLLQ